MRTCLLGQWKVSSAFFAKPTRFPGATPAPELRHCCIRHLASAAAAAPMAAGQADTVSMLASFSREEDRTAFTSRFNLADGAVAALHCQSLDSSDCDACHNWLDRAVVFSHLTSQHMGRVLLSTPSIPSTQDFMRQHTSVVPDGAVLVADQQTKGKGRGGNVWTSPAGCLMFTALRQLQVHGVQAAFINYVVCLAVVKGIKEATQHLLPGGLDVQIKWPNDIYFQGVKIGGALIHTTWAASTQQFCVLTGIGLNVSNRHPTTCLDEAIQAEILKQREQSRQVEPQTLQDSRVCKEHLLAAVLNHLELCFDQFQAEGFEPLKPLYLSSWMHSHQVVELSEDAEMGPPGRRVRLTIVGLSPHGFLLAQDDLGQEYELTPDGNSLDMMHGLIKKKL